MKRKKGQHTQYWTFFPFKKHNTQRCKVLKVSEIPLYFSWGFPIYSFFKLRPQLSTNWVFIVLRWFTLSINNYTLMYNL